MVTITTDGIEVSGETERDALKALRKAQASARQREAMESTWRETARLRSQANAWRLLDRFVDGDFRNMELVEAGEPCGPAVVMRGICPVLQFQAPNGDCAEIEFFSTVRIECGIIDGGGWLLAVRIRNSFGSVDETDWLAIGAECTCGCSTRLPKSFTFTKE